VRGAAAAADSGGARCARCSSSEAQQAPDAAATARCQAPRQRGRPPAPLQYFMQPAVVDARSGTVASSPASPLRRCSKTNQRTPPQVGDTPQAPAQAGGADVSRLSPFSRKAVARRRGCAYLPSFRSLFSLFIAPFISILTAAAHEPLGEGQACSSMQGSSGCPLPTRKRQRVHLILHLLQNEQEQRPFILSPECRGSSSASSSRWHELLPGSAVPETVSLQRYYGAAMAILPQVVVQTGVASFRRYRPRQPPFLRMRDRAEVQAHPHARDARSDGKFFRIFRLCARASSSEPTYNSSTAGHARQRKPRDSSPAVAR